MSNKLEDKSWREAQKKVVFCGPFEDDSDIDGIEVTEEYIQEHGGFVLIQESNGKIYPCALDEFEEMYEVE